MVLFMYDMSASSDIKWSRVEVLTRFSEQSYFALLKKLFERNLPIAAVSYGCQGTAKPASVNGLEIIFM